MEGKAPGVEIAHKTTMSILGKLSSYSWNAKAVLTLAAFALDYEDFLALPHLHSSHQLDESVEIPKHVPVTLKHLDLEKCGKTIGELNKIINYALAVMKDILDWSKPKHLKTSSILLYLVHACTKYNNIEDDPEDLSLYVGHTMECAYWIIITVVACRAQMCCLTSNEDVTQDLLPLAQKMIRMRGLGIVGLDTSRNLEKLFVRDTMQPLIDGSTNEMVSIDVLKKKNLLLFISSLNNIYMNDILDLMSIYDGMREKGDQYKIVWIPVVEQWTNNLQKKFEILRSKMPWYIVQYISTVAGIKFIKETFNNKPIVVVMNPQGDVENKNALFMIQQRGMDAFSFDPDQLCKNSVLMRPPGPYAIEEYTFFCGGKDDKWIEQFSKRVNVVSEDPLIEKENIFIELSRVGKGWKTHDFDEKIQKLLRPFKNESKWAVFVNNFSEATSNDGTTIMNVLEAFEEWKVNVHERGFEICFKQYHDRLLQIGPLPSTSKNV
ncbi:hypothetical protein FH972_004439 [Carpinus fangiana]|uniref:Sieve element occlusion N-terminal domain-containing protein n=1 Tax=Carpinus fangiana TaxID=176857 RepID=A0A5N6QMZ8_9ROSI|nr:hypothetical protein FH972_004439 [Carpinus fangiana]